MRSVPLSFLPGDAGPEGRERLLGEVMTHVVCHVGVFSNDNAVWAQVLA
jgi:hypothetical protein